MAPGLHPPLKTTRPVRRFALGLGCAALALAFLAALAQSRIRRAPSTVNVDRGNIPTWQLEPAFARDCFTFVRIKYRSTYERSSHAWWTDYPDADLNFSWRLHQLTSLRVDPDGRVIELTDPQLFEYPFIFMSGVPGMVLSDEEIDLLRRYLLRGGFLMVDDFWGERDWEEFDENVLDRLFPNREPKELPLDHEIFHAVFDLKEKPQIPNVGFARSMRGTGITWEKPDAREPHYRGITDDKGRLMVLVCHNTDLGDGWEEEATDPDYFAEFSEKKAYPLGINIVMYVLAH